MSDMMRGKAGLAMMCSAESVTVGGQWMGRDELAHFGIPGMKHGRRRYQSESGEWTPLGLKERREREGFGEKKKSGGNSSESGKKSSGSSGKSSSNASSLKSLFKKKESAKNLSDDELKTRINRLKMEKEYLELQKANRELSKSPLLETAQNLVKSYTDAKIRKEERAQKKYQLENSRLSSMAALEKAKAEKIEAKSNLFDTVTFGKGRMEARKNLIETKSKHTITGALRDVANRVINKEGSRLVKEMGDKSLTMRAGRAVKSGAKNAYSKGKQLAKDVYTAAGDVVLDIKYPTGKTSGSVKD